MDQDQIGHDSISALVFRSSISRCNISAIGMWFLPSPRARPLRGAVPLAEYAATTEVKA